MATTQQPPTPVAGSVGEPCASCGAPLAADQRYCLSCGTRRGEPRVAPAAGTATAEPAPTAATTAASTADSGRPADVSPLAAVIGIALLGGMLLIGVLIGRGGTDDEPTPAPTIQVGDAATTGAPDVERRKRRRVGRDQRVAAGHRRVHDPAQHGAQGRRHRRERRRGEADRRHRGGDRRRGARFGSLCEPAAGQLRDLLGRLHRPQVGRGGAQGPAKELSVGRGDRGLRRRSAAGRRRGPAGSRRCRPRRRRERDHAAADPTGGRE